MLGLALVILVAALWALRKTDVIIAIVLGGLVLLTGRAVFRSYSVTKGPTGPATDVQEQGKLLVYACEVCGEQLVLLRRGTDAPPRHCSEKMVLRHVDVPDRELN
jgi:high-affinity Fe2+/Pb2+ permease